MNNKLYSVSCDPKCGFVVKSHDKNEAVDVAFANATKVHPEEKAIRDQVVRMVVEG